MLQMGCAPFKFMEDNKLKPNKRKKLRVPLLITKVKVEQTGKFFFGYAKNISKTGMFIQSVNPKEVGERFRLEFKLPKDTRTISCTAEVRWKRGYRPWEDHEPGMGLEFIEIEKEMAKIINNWGITTAEEAT